MTSPQYSSGVEISVSMIGSSRIGCALATASLKRHRAGYLERELRRVDLVVAAVEQFDLYVGHRVAGEDTLLGRFPDALFHRRNELLGNGATGDLALSNAIPAPRSAVAD